MGQNKFQQTEIRRPIKKVSLLSFMAAFFKLAGNLRVCSARWRITTPVTPSVSTVTYKQVSTDAPSTDRLDFSDYRRALRTKSWRELYRALLVLTICSNETFSANSLTVR